MLHTGHNEIEGVPVEVVRKRIRRINIRVAADGTVCLSVPKWWATTRREWGETCQDAHLAQTPASRQTFGLEDIQLPSVAPELTAASTVAQPAAFGCLRATRSGYPRAPAAPVTQQGAKRHKPTFVQTEFWE